MLGREEKYLDKSESRNSFLREVIKSQESVEEQPNEINVDMDNITVDSVQTSTQTTFIPVNQLENSELKSLIESHHSV